MSRWLIIGRLPGVFDHIAICAGDPAAPERFYRTVLSAPRIECSHAGEGRAMEMQMRNIYRSADSPLKMTSCVVVVSVLAAILAPSASANWTRISGTPSTTEPYYVCPPRAHQHQYQLIEDPVRGSHAREPVRAGAITAGPVDEVSLALYASL